MASKESLDSAFRPRQPGLVACHECDLLHHAGDIPSGARALCSRCGAELYRHVPNSLDRSLALYLTSLLLFLLANVFPFLSLKIGGRVEDNILLSASLAFFREGMGELGILVFLTSILFPFVTIAGMLYILLPLKFGQHAPGTGRVYRLVSRLMPWSLIGVFMLGVLVSVVKLLDLATVIPGVSLFAFAGLLVSLTAARTNLDVRLIWPHQTVAPSGIKPAPAAALGLVSCHACGLLAKASGLDHHSRCPRCDGPLHLRRHNSLMRTWALLAAAALLLIPANVYPVMTVIQLGKGEPNTILSGIVHLIEAGMWGLALLIFFASMVVPVMKLIVLGWLLVTVQRSSAFRPLDRTRLYRVTELVGAWSMVDVFLVAILTALVNLGALATIRPGIGVTFFAAVVVLTMLAAHSFDPRLIWDKANNNNDEQRH